MKATVVNLVQGTQAWLDHRAENYNASEAPVMLGISSTRKRTALMTAKHTGIEEEIDYHKQERFDKGHEFEDQARPWAAAIIGEKLYPVSVKAIVFGLPMAASLDGITMDETITWEHKWLNQELAASLKQGIIPDEHHPQMEQGLMLTGAKKCLFMASNGDEETMRHCWYEPNMSVRKQVIQGWQQFDEDLKTFEYKAPAAVLVGSAPGHLPKLQIDVTGMVRSSNIDAFRTQALNVFNAVKVDLRTDQDFANAISVGKFCADVEQRIDAAKDMALSQTSSIEELFRTLDEIKETSRTTRLKLNKLVDSKKASIKIDLVNEFNGKFNAHMDSLNARLGDHDNYMPPTQVRFGDAIKGLKTIDSMRDKLTVALAEAKISANEIADRIDANLKYVMEFEHDHLVPDITAICMKPVADFNGLIALRLQRHKEQVKEKKDREDRLAEEQADRDDAKQAQEDHEAATIGVDPAEPGGDATVAAEVGGGRIITADGDDLLEIKPGPVVIKREGEEITDIIAIRKDDLEASIDSYLAASKAASRTKATIKKHLLKFISEYI